MSVPVYQDPKGVEMSKRFLLGIIFPVLLSGAALAQQGTGFSGPFFFLDVANLAAKDSTLARLVVFVKVPYSQLLFSKYKEKFEAEYDFDVAIYDEKKELVVQNSKVEKLYLTNVAEADKEQRLSFSRMKFNVQPGSYSVVATITDRERNRTGRRSTTVNLKNFRNEPLGVSDIIFADKVDKDQLNDVTNIHPNVFKSFEDQSANFYAYFEIYDETFSRKNLEIDSTLSSALDEIKVEYRILDKEQKAVYADTFVQTVNKFQTFTAVDLSGLKIRHGKYLLDVTVKKGSFTAKTGSSFDIRWNTSMSGEVDVKLAIRQMEYIAWDINLRKILKKGDDEMKDFFVNFWKGRDPTPSTAKNEVMEEYYKRIGYANRYYSTAFRDGWETDMGMVYVTLGAPDELQRYPYEPNLKPYEVWYYYNLNTKLIFVDSKGFGEYELANRFDFEDIVHR